MTTPDLKAIADIDVVLADAVRQLSEAIKDKDVSFMVRRDVWKHSHSKQMDFAFCVAVVVVGEGSYRECKNFDGPDLQALIAKAVEWHASRLATYS